MPYICSIILVLNSFDVRIGKEDILFKKGSAVLIDYNLKDFFSEDEDEQIVFSKDDFFENIQDDYKISYIIPNAQKNEMEPILIELKKGKKSMEIDPHDGEEFGYVIHGKITLMNGDEEYEVKKGETFYLKGNLPHYIVNKHDTLAKVIWVSTPPIF